MTIYDMMRALNPTLATATDAELAPYVMMAQNLLSPCVWGALWMQGIALLALHYQYVAAVRSATSSGGAAGPVTSEMAGRVQVTYGSLQAGWEKNPLLTSPYGQELEALRNRLAGRKGFNTGFRAEDMCHPWPPGRGEDN